MKAFVFPGQGSQFTGMGKNLYENDDLAKDLFNQANEILGFNITETMFNGPDDELKQTHITQPAIFLHSVILAQTKGKDIRPDMVAGHSLGEFSALVANGALSFENGLILVQKRANAMQKMNEAEPSTMAAIIGMEDKQVEDICSSIKEIVVPANYNSTGQIVISGTVKGIDLAIEKLQQAGAKRAIKLPVSGAFHSPLMQGAKEELEAAIKETHFEKPFCPVYQNVNAEPSVDPSFIRKNLVEQLVSPVRWTQSVRKMISGGATSFIEIGPGKVLQGLIKKIDRSAETQSL